MPAKPTTVAGYLRSVDAARRPEFETLRSWVRGVLPAARETMSYRMPTYEGPDQGLICAIAAQKHHLALYVCVDGAVDRHRAAFSELDVGKGCIRFRHLADLPRTAARRLLKEAAREVSAGASAAKNAGPASPRAARGGSRRAPAAKQAAATKKAAKVPRGKVGVGTLRELALALPAVEEGTSYGTPAWRVKGKWFARLREDGDSVAMKVGDELRDLLMEADPDRYFTTDHYVGYPIVLLRLSNIPRADLANVLEEGWRLAAPKRLREAREASG